MPKNINLSDNLFIGGFNIERWKGNYEVGTGRLEKVAKNIFINASLTPADRKEVLNTFAVRIAKQLFPSAVLIGSSAYHRAPVDGILAISTPRGRLHVDVGGVFKIYNMKSDLDRGMNREVETALIEDQLGTMSMSKMSDAMLIIKNLRPVRGRPASTYLNPVDLGKVIERYATNFSSHDEMTGRLVELLKVHGMADYEKRLLSTLKKYASYDQDVKMLERYDVYWHTFPVATLNHDGHIWHFNYRDNVNLQLSLTERKGKGAPPSFLASLLPEVGRDSSGGIQDALEDFKSGSRYISNISVKPSGLRASAEGVIEDILAGELKDFRTGMMEFNGSVDGLLVGAVKSDSAIGRLQKSPGIPRISGMQAKIPANLDTKGRLTTAEGRAFTHIIKVVGSNPVYSSMSAMEWFSLTIGKLCGIKVEEFAIVDIGGYGPSLVVERFDIKRDMNDRRMILSEDFWSIFGHSENARKYHGELLEVADKVVKHSTQKEEDGRHLLAQSIFSWLSFNSDMHLKNMMMLKETRDPSKGFEKVCLSPVYDVLCTQVYPNDAKSSAINLAGSRHHGLAGFRMLGAKFGISKQEVDAMCENLALSIPLWAEKVAKQLPEVIRNHQVSVDHIRDAIKYFRARSFMMLKELEAASKKRASQPEQVESFGISDDDDEDAMEHVMAERRRSGIEYPARTPDATNQGENPAPTSVVERSRMRRAAMKR